MLCYCPAIIVDCCSFVSLFYFFKLPSVFQSVSWKFLYFSDCADFNNGVSALVVCGSQPPKMEMEIWINLKSLCQEDCHLPIKRNIFHIYSCVKLEFIVNAVNSSDTFPRPLHIVFIRILGCVNCSRFTSKKHGLFMRDSSWPWLPRGSVQFKMSCRSSFTLIMSLVLEEVLDFAAGELGFLSQHAPQNFFASTDYIYHHHWLGIHIKYGKF